MQNRVSTIYIYIQLWYLWKNVGPTWIWHDLNNTDIISLSLSLSLSLFPEFLSLLFLTTPHNFTHFVSLFTSIATPKPVSLFSFFIQRFLLFQILCISKKWQNQQIRETHYRVLRLLWGKMCVGFVNLILTIIYINI